MKKALVLLVFIIIFVSLVGYFLTIQPARITTPSPVTEGIKEKTEFTSLKEVVNLKQDMKCEWRKDDQFFSTTFVSGERSFSEITRQGKKGWVIMKDDCLWTWEEGSFEGTKVCLEDKSSGQPDLWTLKGQAEEGSYRCGPTSVDEAVFTPPSEIKFIEE